MLSVIKADGTTAGSQASGHGKIDLIRGIQPEAATKLTAKPLFLICRQSLLCSYPYSVHVTASFVHLDDFIILSNGQHSGQCDYQDAA
jgi:hypothetical protein